MSDHLADMRRSYERGGLAEAELGATWLEQFTRWLEEAVAAGLTEPNAMVLATADAEGAPSTRTVLLKGVGPRGFVLYTNLRSRKGRQAAANPHASLTFLWTCLQRQVGVSGRLEPVAELEADAYFASRPRGSQLGAHASPQSEVVADRGALEANLEAAERRWPAGTDVPRPPAWGGLRVVPEQVEFWQGRPNRLHDRLRYRRDGEAWVVERLAP